ncbi:uncharacterized protein AC631_01915 [Debaryomyces fabryi]|uniref:peptidylprolyl isomerase n=1 Tax=Debaryomyces fabryi TaxID=58627 RepID=A0A0V1Q259_9ASCO|nr:uncharacterized protein AC631_01915 [Debaryomyces fabryi]KSA02357.1 hypothetical protein AC631_01915 [Debaryomyces fabryi]CUM51571.1 unnamed protein product [Debaryomyces fabryi]
MKLELIRPCSYIDISIGGTKTGRIVVELFEDLAPKASENFIKLCNGSQKSQEGSPLTFKGNYFHRIIKNFVVQAGDIENGTSIKDYPNLNIGKGGVSIYNNDTFEDENLSEPLDSPFKLCMANDGTANANKSQFFITTFPQPHLNGKHTVFGKVIHGKSVVREMERVDTDSQNIPKKENIVFIEDCGDWTEDMDIPVYNACYDQIGGDIYEEYPDDDEYIDKESSELVYNASTKIKESGTLLFKKGMKQEAFLKYRKCLRYVMEYIPDEDQEPDWYKKYLDIKKKLYLNLSMVCLGLKNFMKAADYSSYLLDMNNLTTQEKAKGHYRHGCALIELKKYDEALTEFKNAKLLVPEDPAIETQLNKCELLIEAKKQNEKAKYAKFFS